MEVKGCSVRSCQVKGDRCGMEDCLIITRDVVDNRSFDILVLCDGHGGPEAALFASNFVSKEIRTNKYIFCKSDETELTKHMSDIFAKAQDAMSKEQGWDSTPYFPFISGCTCSVLVVTGDKLVITTLGDSRVLVVTHAESLDGPTNFVASTDHRLSNYGELCRIKNLGGKIEISNHLKKLVFVENCIAKKIRRTIKTELTRSLGDFYAKNEFGARLLSIQPDVQVKQIRKTTTVVLASDGFWDVVSNSEAAQAVNNQNRSPLTCPQANIAEKLCCLALSNYITSESDSENITCAVVSFGNIGSIEAPIVQLPTRGPPFLNPFKRARHEKPKTFLAIIEEIDLATLKQMWKEKEKSGDVTIKVKGKHVILAHAAVLECNSITLKSRIQQQRMLHGEKNVTLSFQNLTSEMLLKCVEFMYTGTISSLNVQDIEKLLQTARELGLESLTNFVFELVTGKLLSIRNLVQILPIVCSPDCPRPVTDTVRNFVLRNMEKIRSETDVVKTIKALSERFLSWLFPE